MNGLFVGQHVRIRWSITWPGLNGKPGRIVARLSAAHRNLLPPGHSGEWEVAPDDWGGSASPDALGFFFPASEQLEPMLPQGVRGVSWEDREWQPADLPEQVLACHAPSAVTRFRPLALAR